MEKTLNEKEEQEFLWRTEHGIDIKFLFASNGGRKTVCDVHGNSWKSGQWRDIWRLDSLLFDKNKEKISYFARFEYDWVGCLEGIEIYEDDDIRKSKILQFRI